MWCAQHDEVLTPPLDDEYHVSSKQSRPLCHTSKHTPDFVLMASNESKASPLSRCKVGMWRALHECVRVLTTVVADFFCLFLFGCFCSTQEQLFIAGGGLLPHLVKEITSDGIWCAGSLQTSFDLLGELCKGNPEVP